MSENKETLYTGADMRKGEVIPDPVAIEMLHGKTIYNSTLIPSAISTKWMISYTNMYVETD